MKRSLVNGLVLVAVAAAAAPSIAQYKWQTPAGETVYSDVPPPGGAQRLNERVLTRAAEPAAGVVDLPYELKTVTSRFPVVLYTAPDCAPCLTARSHLSARGVPFSEKTVSTLADFDAFKGQGFSDNSFPALTVGRDRTVGFEAGAWDRLLTAAGYPKSSQLPPRYRQAAAEPLTPPSAQRLTVNLRREAGADPQRAGAAQPLDTPSVSQRAIEQYRQSLQAAQRTQRAADDSTSLRF